MSRKPGTDRDFHDAVEDLRRANRPSAPAYCIICGYNLAHGTSDRCPECGARFDPEDPSTTAASQSLLHRVARHAPRIHAWIVERFGTINCRTCGRILAPGAAGRCPGCNGWYDPTDLTTITRALRIVPPAVLRLRHVCVLRGAVAPACLVVYGLYCVITGGAFLPGMPTGRAFLHLGGAAARAMGVAWLGLGTALHAHYFWGRVEPAWRLSAVPTAIGLALFLAGWGYALWRAAVATLGS